MAERWEKRDRKKKRKKYRRSSSTNTPSLPFARRPVHEQLLMRFTGQATPLFKTEAEIRDGNVQPKLDPFAKEGITPEQVRRQIQGH